jgi:hypothetical protein
MHFHSAIQSSIRDTIGLGKTGAVTFYKYSTRIEKFIGFDQAYVRSELSPQELKSVLESMIRNPNGNGDKKVSGYFLQFKVVEKKQKKSVTMPPGFNTPYLRSKLATRRDARDRYSQHQVLKRLAANSGAIVYYACPMIFDREELYDPNINTDLLRLIELSPSIGEFDDNRNHSICFQNISGDPYWCSEPQKGDCRDLREFANQVVSAINADGESRISYLTPFLELVTSRASRLEFQADTGASDGSDYSQSIYDSNTAIEALTLVIAS